MLGFSKVTGRDVQIIHPPLCSSINMITKTVLENSLEYLLKPIIRLCVKYGVKVNQVEQVTKTLFVHEAKKFLYKNKQPESVSKISIMTGMQRPLIITLAGKSPANFQENLITKVIGLWCSKKKYLTTKGSPRILSVEGKSSEFAQLVKSVSQALNPYTVLFELERAQLVQRTSGGLKLLTSSFNSSYDVEQSIQFLAQDITDLTASVEENISSKNNPVNHHLTTEYDSIPADKAHYLQKVLMAEGDKFHKKMRHIISKFDCDIQKINSKQPSVRIAVCSFSICEKGNNKC